MSTLPVNEKVQDNGHDSASDDAKAAPEPPKPKRSPTYHVFEHQVLARVVTENEVEGGKETVRVVEQVGAWVLIAKDVKGATDRKAIESVIGTAEEPCEGFDTKRRLGQFWAPLVVEFEPRKRKREVSEGWA